MSRDERLIDLLVAVLFALLVLILSPGLAVAALIALAALGVCALSAVWSRARRKPRPRPVVRPRAPRR